MTGHLANGIRCSSTCAGRDGIKSVTIKSNPRSYSNVDLNRIDQSITSKHITTLYLSSTNGNESKQIQISSNTAEALALQPADMKLESSHNQFLKNSKISNTHSP